MTCRLGKGKTVLFIEGTLSTHSDVYVVGIVNYYKTRSRKSPGIVRSLHERCFLTTAQLLVKLQRNVLWSII